MEFKKLNTRAVILIAIAGVLILMTILSNIKSKSVEIPNDPVLTPQTIEQHFVTVPAPDEDEAAQKEMKSQMDRDRDQQRQIKMLKMQLEQINLQLDNEKAMTEINKLKKENSGTLKTQIHQVGLIFRV